MATDLPTNIDATYADRSPGDAEHQRHHDEIHAYTNSHDTAPDPHGDRAHADGLVTDHVNDVDPHPQYAKTAGDTFIAASPSATPLIVEAAVGQTATLQEWRASDDSIVTAVLANGRLQVNGQAAVQFTGDLGGSFTPGGASANSIQLVIDGVAYRLPIYTMP